MLPAQNPFVHQLKDDEKKAGNYENMYVHRTHDLFIYFKVHVSSKCAFLLCSFSGDEQKSTVSPNGTLPLVFNFVSSLPFTCGHFYFVIMVADFIRNRFVNMAKS